MLIVLRDMRQGKTPTKEAAYRMPRINCETMIWMTATRRG